MKSKSSKILLLNPPSKDIVIRDNYCSKISQASYINHPVDLVIQSGFLRQNFDVVLIDAVVQKLSIHRTLEIIRALNPLGIYALTGNASWYDDCRFFEKLKSENPHVKLAMGGDIFLENPKALMNEHKFIDAIITDFTTPDLTRYFLGNSCEFTTVITREDNLTLSSASKSSCKKFEIPIPMHDLFITLDYRYPFVFKTPFATVMTEYGCPFQCLFCVMNTLGHKTRPVENVMDELRYLYEKGIRDIFFVDQSFGSIRDRSQELCDRIALDLPKLRWLCFSRVDLVDERFLRKMQKAGCHTIIFGVETANPDLLERYKKNYRLRQVETTFNLAKKLKLRTVATFLLGLPGETFESALNTIEFAKTLDCDFASLNVAVPRMGTELRNIALKEGYIDASEHQFDQSGTEVIMNTKELSRNDLIKLKKIAIKSIYLRPNYIIRRFLALKSFSEFRIQSREAFHLFKKFLLENHE